jgi:hypothetical protein
LELALTTRRIPRSLAACSTLKVIAALKVRVSAVSPASAIAPKCTTASQPASAP